MGYDGVYKKLGDFNIDDVNYQLSAYQSRIDAMGVERSRFEWLKRDIISHEYTGTIRSNYASRESELTEVFGG
jgi:hypothetical protein